MKMRNSVDQHLHRPIERYEGVSLREGSVPEEPWAEGAKLRALSPAQDRAFCPIMRLPEMSLIRVLATVAVL